MPDIKLPDGKKIPFSKKIDGFEIANKISKSLAKEACVMNVNGELKDLSFSIVSSATVKIITSKDKEGLEVIRHDAAHVLGLIAGGKFQDPIGDGVDVVTASTHKTFPGPQHGIILANVDNELPNGKMLHKTIRSRVFPGVHSNHHLHKVAALGVSLAEAIEFQSEYASDIIDNAEALAEGLWSRGMKVFAPDHGFTKSHTILVDVQEIP